MSIATQLFEHKITLSQAWTQAESWGTKLVANDPAFTQATGDLVALAKGLASQIDDLALTALGKYTQPLAASTETALEAYFAGITGGASVPLNPAISGALDQGAKIISDAAQAKLLELKARLAGNPAVIAAPPQPGS